VIDKCQD